MDTKSIMNLAISMVDFPKIKGESAVYNQGGNIKNVLFGIDVFRDDLIAAKAAGYDLVISHHPPEKRFTMKLVEEIEDQIDLLVKLGIQSDLAEKAVNPTIQLYQEWNQGKNHNESIAFSKETGIALMNIHQPCDELGRRYFQSIIDELGPDITINELITKFKSIEEIKNSDEDVELVTGDLLNKIGKTVFFHGVGTNGGYTVANLLFDAGFDTVVYIHLLPYQKADRERLKLENRGNLILTGHYASDSIGVNLFIKALLEKGLSITKGRGLY
jgi:hypothetical protein